MENGTQKTIETLATPTDAKTIAADVVTQLQGMGLNAELDEAGTKITVSTVDGTAVSWINDDADGIAYTDNQAIIVELDATTGANSATIAGAINAASEAATKGIVADPKIENGLIDAIYKGEHRAKRQD